MIDRAIGNLIFGLFCLTPVVLLILMVSCAISGWLIVLRSL